jgi:hypothetical protein
MGSLRECNYYYKVFILPTWNKLIQKHFRVKNRHKIFQAKCTYYYKTKFIKLLVINCSLQTIIFNLM